MCCLARRGPQPRHRWLHSSPHAGTQSTERFNILLFPPHTHTCMRVCLYLLPKRLCSLCATLLLLALTALVYDESSSVRHVRRMFHPGRGLGGPRARRTNMHFTSSSTGGLSSSSSQSSSYNPSNREAMDPIAGECQGLGPCVLLEKSNMYLCILWLISIHTRGGGDFHL